MDKLMPPLVVKLREQVKDFRNSNYSGATDTSKSLLNWRFSEKHLILTTDGLMREFQYFFAQREALETVIYDAIAKTPVLKIGLQGALKVQNFTY
jgi:type III restriction enzyme